MHSAKFDGIPVFGGFVFEVCQPSQPTAIRTATKTILASRILTGQFNLISLFCWCPEGDLNPHDRLRSADFKSAVSADFTIRACIHIVNQWFD